MRHLRIGLMLTTWLLSKLVDWYIGTAPAGSGRSRPSASPGSPSGSFVGTSVLEQVQHLEARQVEHGQVFGVGQIVMGAVETAQHLQFILLHPLEAALDGLHVPVEPAVACIRSMVPKLTSVVYFLLMRLTSSWIRSTRVVYMLSGVVCLSRIGPIISGSSS